MINKIIADIHQRFPETFTNILNLRNARNIIDQISIDELVYFFDNKSMFIEIKYVTPEEWRFRVNGRYYDSIKQWHSENWGPTYGSRPLAQQAAIKYVCELIRKKRIDKQN